MLSFSRKEPDPQPQPVFPGQGASAGEAMRYQALHRSGDPGEAEVPRRARGHLVVRDRPRRDALWG